MSKSRNYCFTSYEHDGGLIWERAGERWAAPTGISYIIWGNEVCPTTGRAHKQGYLELTGPLGLSGVKRLLATNSIHLETRKGTAAQAIEYCKKDGDWEEHGEAKAQGKRSDLEAIKKHIDKGMSSLEIAEAHWPKWVIYRRSFDEYRTLKGLDEVRDKSNAPKVIYIHGPSGCGKTRFAIEAGATCVDFNGKFMLNYNGEKTVLFDDVDRDMFPNRSVMLRLLDRYPMKVEIKGGSVQWLATTIYMTSNYSLTDLMWDKDDAIRRRITRVIHMDVNGTDVNGTEVVGGNTNPDRKSVTM